MTLTSTTYEECVDTPEVPTDDASLSHIRAPLCSGTGKAGTATSSYSQPSVVSPYTEKERAACAVDENEFRRLKKQAHRLEQMLQVMPAGVVVIDGFGTVRQANALARKLLGEPLEGQVWRDIISRSFRPRADDGHEVSLRDGRKVKLSITPLTGEPGQMIVMTDLTETRQLQQRISHMQRLSALGKTVASLVHQIRTPLSAAMLYAANIGSDKLAEESRKRFVNKLQSRLGELEHQVNDMLLFAKSGEKQVLQRTSIATLIEEIEQGAEAMLSEAQVAFTTRMDKLSVAPEAEMMINRSAVTGAFHNLIHNAIQVGATEIKLNVTDARRANSNHWCEISVIDNGPGLPADKQARLFEPFYTTKSQGTGLGLAVVQSVVKSHQGKIDCHNNSQGGATFTLRLPLMQPSSSAHRVVQTNKSDTGEML